MKPRSFFNTAFFIILGVMYIGTILASSSFAEEKKATISDIVLTNTRDDLLLYFIVKNCFTPSITKAIETGIKTTFTFTVQLYETQRFWPDKTIANLKFQHQIEYDNLKRVYTIRLSERKNGVIEVKNFGTAKKLMSEVVALKVTSMRNLKKGTHYQVRMMAELDKIRLPFHLDSVLFFLSLWDFETGWYTLDFRY